VRLTPLPGPPVCPAEPGRPEDVGGPRTRPAGGGPIGLPCLPQARRQRQRWARARADRDRREDPSQRDRALPPGGAEHHAVLRGAAAAEVRGADGLSGLPELASHPPAARLVEVTSNR